MFISLKKFLSGGGEPAEALLRVAQLLLQAIEVHAVVGDQADYEKFQKDMQDLQASLGGQPSNSEALVVAGATAKTLEDYNQRTTRFIRAQSAELQTMLSMLTDTLASLSGGSDRSVSRLQSIEKQLEKASMIEDIRGLKVRLSDCLGSLREEAQRQREESARNVTALKEQIRKAQQRTAVTRRCAPAVDPATGLLGRDEAEKSLGRALQEGAHVFAAAFVIDRIELINSRFGYAVGDQVLRFFRQHLAHGLSVSDPVYLWGASSFLALLERPGTSDECRRELLRIASVRLEKTIQVGTRTVLLPVTSSWSIVPVFEAPSLEQLVKRIDGFASGQRVE